MSVRQSLEVALRIMGIWFLINLLFGLAGIGSVFATYGASAAPNQNLSGYYITSALILVIQSFFCLGLIYYAPLVAARFYRNEDDTSTTATSSHIGPGHLYHLACFVLGMYFLISASEPVGHLVSAGLKGFSADGITRVAFTAVVYVAAGLILVFGSQRIARMLTGLRYDPDAIPKQQLSISFLLGVVVFFAVLLGVLKLISG